MPRPKQNAVVRAQSARTAFILIDLSRNSFVYVLFEDGTDLYWANTGQDIREVQPLTEELAGLCRAAGKRHHQWLQCWGVRAGNEARVGSDDLRAAAG